MPKYLTRVEFESMKVLRKRGGTIKEIGDHMHLSYGAVSRNLKYNSYEDYCLSTARGQRKRDALNGPVKIIKPVGKVKAVEPVEKVKLCNKCGKEKSIDEFDTCPQNKDGHTGKCKACRRAYQRKLSKRNRRLLKAATTAPVKKTEKPVQVTHWYSPVRDCWYSEPKAAEEPAKEEKPKFTIDQYVLVEHKGKVRGAHIVAKCSEEYKTKWVVELCNWRRTKLVMSECDIYTEGAC